MLLQALTNRTNAYIELMLYLWIGFNVAPKASELSRASFAQHYLSPRTMSNILNIFVSCLKN